ncbi:hypothetical protein NP233_g1182 [Leucocoprinus birnbaumii]|uniref:S-adenosyl-L-methionine-dependent methyltransferase n=1 Tax=Leucocoprinus birnbaumii TaxID=56174 RepID=A0AAD5W0T6_9AGAR|nr:hypothetical protein NP233_g1182 [Leucocoprinus birnbaumii]
MSNYTIQNDDIAPEQEVERLDDLHVSITGYLDGRLSFAPLESLSPSLILELGSGSGAWYVRMTFLAIDDNNLSRAIQAAKQFPNARVTAADMTELPARVLPPNMAFKKVDLTQTLPFDRESFDIIHARLTMMHVREFLPAQTLEPEVLTMYKLPQAMDILRRVTQCLKSGGWLIVEEPDDDCFWNNGGPPGRNIEKLLGAWHRSMRERGAEPCIGRLLEDDLRALGMFTEIHSHYVDIPLSNQSSVTSENQLGAGWQRTMRRVIPMLKQSLSSYGITDAILEAAQSELDDPEKSLTTRMYFTWSKKS